jgi:large subunit ribosomal protein L3
MRDTVHSCGQFLFQIIKMKFILGTKLNMSQIFDEQGRVHPVTILEATPSVVTQVKNENTDGYNAIQVGVGAGKEKKGHMKETGIFRTMKEFRIKAGVEAPTYNKGDLIDLSSFAVGDTVTISAISKGKGFQGVIKRHGFKGGPRSHGQKHSEHAPGSIGAVWPQRVLKGKRMGGRMGGDRITVKNLKVAAIDLLNHKIMIRGAIPGRRGTLVEVRG